MNKYFQTLVFALAAMYTFSVSADEVSDLKDLIQVKFINYICNIILRTLQSLELKEWPMHCSDEKRQIVYIKENNVWIKEDFNNNTMLKDMIIDIVQLTTKAIPAKYVKMFPKCISNHNSREHTEYNTIVFEAFGGNSNKANSKIIARLVKMIKIDKKQKSDGSVHRNK